MKDRETSSVNLNTDTGMKYICGDRVKGVYGQSRPKIRGGTPSPVSQAQKQTRIPTRIHHGATAATKWTNTSLTSKEMFFFLKYSIQTVVYLGTKLLEGSHESLDAANPFQRTL